MFLFKKNDKDKTPNPQALVAGAALAQNVIGVNPNHQHLLKHLPPSVIAQAQAAQAASMVATKPITQPQPEQQSNIPPPSEISEEKPSDNPEDPTASVNLPFNLKRAELTHEFTYERKATVMGEHQQPDSSEKEEVDENAEVRVNVLQTSVTSNPYFFDMEHSITINDKALLEEQKQREEEERKKEEENRVLLEEQKQREEEERKKEEENQAHLAEQMRIEEEIRVLLEEQKRKEEEEKKKEMEEAEEKEREKLRDKVFAFFTESGSEFSEFVRLLAQLNLTGEKFTDENFPPTMKSIIGNNEMRRAQWGSAVWLRPDDFYGPGNYKVFMGDIEPNDIKQGELGDCYFLSTISSLAEWPDRIRKLFATKEPNPCGVYSVKVCDMGEWKEVVVDDYFPCDKYLKRPIFTRGNDQELWVLLLEKVWAKLYGSYDAVDAGFARECLHDLTGAPTQFYLTDRREEWENIWKKLLEGEGANHCMTCGAGDFFDQGGNDVNNRGIVSSHAYSLLSAHEVETPYRGKTRLVKLRNPWGKIEWQGAFNDYSYEWTPELRAKLGVEDKEDGVFFMPYEDFLQNFTDIQFCYVHDDYKYHSLRVTSEPRHAKYFRVKIDTPGDYYFTVNQESKRKHADNPYYRYSSVSLVVSKVVGHQEYEYVTGNNRADKEVWAQGTFTPGEYIIYAKIEMVPGRHPDFVLSSYGPGKVEMEVVSKQGLGDILEKTFITKARLSTKRMSYAREGEASCFSTVDITKDGFIYIYFNNMSGRTLETRVLFKDFRGLKLRKPYRGKEFKLQVPPKQEKIVLMTLLPNQDVRQVMAEQVRFI